MKRLLALLLIAAMTVSLTACGNKKATESDSTESIVETESESESEEESEEESKSEEESESETETDSESEAEANNETEAADNAAYHYTDLNQSMWARNYVNVRSEPAESSAQIGALAQYQGIVVTGQCNENGWYRVSYNDQTGYISGDLLMGASEMEAIQQQQAAAAQQQANAAASNVSSANAGQQASASNNGGGQASGTGAASQPAQTQPEQTTTDPNAWRTGWLSTSYVYETPYAATDLLALVNADRAANGVGALVWDAACEQNAKNRLATVMSIQRSTGQLSHQGMTAGFGENLAFGIGMNTATICNQAWINSAGHHQTRIDPYNVYYGAAFMNTPEGVYVIECFQNAERTIGNDIEDEGGSATPPPIKDVGD